jgi:3-isopropylmalate/(R)-2-methylmalate dehydratase small subunit
MPSRAFTTLTSRYCVLAADHVDTDQIIPARFLTTTERTGLGRHAFHDWRHRADGTPNPDFVLERPESAGARILVAGRNFGCGSSREHAVWALLGAGIDVVVSSQFADIFRGNALGNGLLPLQVADDVIADLVALAASTPAAALTVDLEAQRLVLPGGREVPFPIAPFARHRLLNGIDEMDFILGAADDIAAYEAGMPATSFSTGSAAGREAS